MSPELRHLPPFADKISSRPARDDTKQPKALVLSVNTPSTFSQKTLQRPSPFDIRAASLASMISTNFSVRFPRSSFNPFFHPARENAWQGNQAREFPPVQFYREYRSCLRDWGSWDISRQELWREMTQFLKTNQNERQMVPRRLMQLQYRSKRCQQFLSKTHDLPSGIVLLYFS